MSERTRAVRTTPVADLVRAACRWSRCSRHPTRTCSRSCIASPGTRRPARSASSTTTACSSGSCPSSASRKPSSIRVAPEAAARGHQRPGRGRAVRARRRGVHDRRRAAAGRDRARVGHGRRRVPAHARRPPHGPVRPRRRWPPDRLSGPARARRCATSRRSRQTARTGLTSAWTSCSPASIFVVTYAAIATERVDKTVAALLGGAAGRRPRRRRPGGGVRGGRPQRHLPARRDDDAWPAILRRTGFFQWWPSARSRSRGRAVPAAARAERRSARGLSAFLDNVTTVVLIAPVTIYIASVLRVSPLPFLISRDPGVATSVGRRR